MDSQSPLISSFVIRFVMKEAQDDLLDVVHRPGERETNRQDTVQHPYRGSIRHIQSDEEMNFHLWEEAVEFIRRYVPLENRDDALTGTETGSDGA